MAFLGMSVKGNNDQDVRRVLSPFTTMLERQSCAAIVLRHLNKGTGAPALYRGGGSIGIIGAARIGLVVGKHDDDETGRDRVLAVQKCNIAPEGPSLLYRLEGVPDTDVATVDWLGEVGVSATDLLGQRSEEERAGVTEAEEWLATLLRHGMMATKDIQAEARKAGIGWRTIETAKRRMGVQAEKGGFARDGVWRWYLPAVTVAGKRAGDDAKAARKSAKAAR